MTSSPPTTVRSSPIHGRGVFATSGIDGARRILEYLGEVVTWEAAIDRYDRRPAGSESTTYFFDRGDGTVIDGGVGGSSARFLNHGCTPNCEAVEESGRVFIQTIGPVDAGEELLLDYALIVDEPDDPDVRELYACRCSSPACRGTMLAVDVTD